MPDTVLAAVAAAAAAPVTQSVSGTLDAPGETASFEVTLVAGHTYMFSAESGDETPLDPLVQLLDGFGAVLATDNDGGLGANALLSFTAPASGTYTVRVAGSDDTVGDFQLDIREMAEDAVPDTPAATTAVLEANTTQLGFIETAGDVDVYRVSLSANMVYTFYLAGGTEPGDPPSLGKDELDTVLKLYDSTGKLLAVADNSSANDLKSVLPFHAVEGGDYYIVASAKGQTGGYSIGMGEESLDGQSPLETIDWGTTLPSNEVSIYFAPAGQTYGGVTSEGWAQYQIDAAMRALGEWASVADLHFSITSDADAATFKVVTGDLGPTLLGLFYPPGEEDAGVGQFDSDGAGWDLFGLQSGGYGFVTLLHEFGHGLGLSHPHDNGGNSPVMPGVTGPNGTLGPFGLNETVYTIMSYNDGWLLHPDAASGMPPRTSTAWGMPMGPSALDIAVIQAKYGAVEKATGNTVYLIPTSNGVGTGYRTVWDTGGIDTFRYDGSARVRIDLTAATLDYSPSGGGVISYARGIFGGLTIANGVVIENAIGGAGRDMLIGNAANNRLDGRGSADVMAGGEGNDTYVVNSRGDVVVELAGQGVDTVETALNNHVLADFVENLRLTGSADLRAYGNALDNILIGNGGSNILDGGGGADQMRGGMGNDVYYVDNAGDKAIEAAGEGTDRVYAGVSYSIAGQFIEILALTGGGDINATGNSLDNRLFGNSGNNVLNGQAGADVMEGGAGDDRYIVDNAGDRVLELAGEGNDTVEASVSFSLAGQHVETLRLTGAAVINGSGNGLANTLIGNGAANVLSGGGGDDALHGGAGADTLIGGAGADSYWFDAALGAGNVDRIADFDVAADSIWLDRAIFTGISANGALAATAFHQGSAAQDADDRIVYDKASGDIWYDADGNGGAAAVLFAHVTANTALTAADFFAAS